MIWLTTQNGSTSRVAVTITTQGVFTSPNPQRMGFCSDIGTLPNYEPADPHFLYSDIQLGKGTPRGIREALFDVNGQEEILNYCIIPCKGVKLCSHTEGCEFVCATKDRRRCPDHPEESLKSSGLFPVEFVCLWPKNSLDRRRWITGLVCKRVHLRNFLMTGETCHGKT